MPCQPAAGKAGLLAVQTVDFEVQRHGGMFEDLERTQLDFVAARVEVALASASITGPNISAITTRWPLMPTRRGRHRR